MEVAAPVSAWRRGEAVSAELCCQKPTEGEKMMIRQCLILSAIVLAGMTWASSVYAQDKDLERWKRSTWQMILKLETPNLVPPAVQWTVLDKDPVPGFGARVKGMQAHYKKQLERVDDEAKKKLLRSSQMTVGWDLGFKEVTGDQVNLLISAPGVSHIVSSNAPGGKKWIATKIVQIKGKPVCWSIPVTVETGKETQLTLTENNMLDLESTFDKAMGESIKDK
jgi:hypothetical protein